MTLSAGDARRRRQGCATGWSASIGVELHLLLEPVAGHVGRDVGDHRLDRCARSRPGRRRSIRQKTVSRMISGGSAGLRTMIALPRCRAADLSRWRWRWSR